MAVGVQLDFRGATLEHYDLTVESSRAPPGRTRGREPALPLGDEDRRRHSWHRRVGVARSVRIVLGDQVGPVLEEMGVVDPPEVQFFEVHNYFAGGRWRR